MASVYAPICYGPLPLLAFKVGTDGRAELAATGALRSCDPDRIVLKKIVLSGYPVKVGVAWARAGRGRAGQLSSAGSGACCTCWCAGWGPALAVPPQGRAHPPICPAHHTPAPLTPSPQTHKAKAVVRFMFHTPEDIRWFRPVELWTKYGRRGRIREPVGTHGAMKCIFDGPLQQRDAVCMSLYKRVYPKWPEDTAFAST